MFRIYFGSPVTTGATRFYLPSTGVAAVSPAFDAGWVDTSVADRLKMVTTRISSAMTSKTLSTALAATEDLLRQYVSDPLEAQVISESVRVYARVIESSGGLNAFARVLLKVVSNDGSTLRGTLFPRLDYGPNTEFALSLTNRPFVDGDRPGSVTAQAGDRLVLEFGFAHGSFTADASINFGDDSATDLGTNETDTAANNPWFEIAQVLAFQAIAVPVWPLPGASIFQAVSRASVY